MGCRRWIICSLCLLLQWVSQAEVIDRAGASSRSVVFNVVDFGATSGRGNIDSSTALMNAWKAACRFEGIISKVVVLIPKGTFLMRPVVLRGPCRGPMVLQVKGILTAPDDLHVFTSEGTAWIEFQYVDGLKVAGGGLFDGQGARAWLLSKKKNCSYISRDCNHLPVSLRFNFVSNAIIGRISSTDSKSFHVMIYGSKNIKIHAVKISAPRHSPNTDGIHVSHSSHIAISRSVIGTGDDCISIGPGNSDVRISDVFCGPGHGISVGSLGRYRNEGDVVGLAVRNCTFTETDNGVRIKTWPSSPSFSSATNFTFEDLVMNNVRNPIVIDQQYCPYSSCDPKSPSRVEISNVVFENIKGSSASKVAVNLLCSKRLPCQNVKLDNIDLDYNYGRKGETSVSYCSNVHGISSGYQVPPPCI